MAAALGMAAGLVLAFRFPVAAGGIPLLLFSAFASLLLINLGGWLSRLAAFVLLGVTFGNIAVDEARNDCRALLADGATVTVRGWLEAVPARETAAMFHVTTIQAEDEWVACAGVVRTRFPPGTMEDDAGESLDTAGIELVGRGRWWAAPQEGNWVVAPQRAGTLLLDSVAAAPGARRAPLHIVQRGEAQLRVRRLFRERGPLAEALILAQRDGLDPAVRERFTRSGLPHLLAISGLHVGLIAGILLLLGRLLRLPPRLAGLAAAGATLGYVLFLGAPHAAARAALQVLLILTARMMQRPANPFALLATAAMVLMAIRPLAVLDPGFQLSFAGTAGIVALRRRLLAGISVNKVPRTLSDSLATTLAATLVTAPIAVLHFNRIAPIGLLANLAAMPLVGLTVPAVALTLVSSYVAWPVAQFTAPAAELLLAGLDRVAYLAASVPGGHLYVTRDAVLGWFAAAAGAAWVTGFLAGSGDRAGKNGRGQGRRRIWFRRGVAVATALALLLAWPTAVRRLAVGLEIHTIDVGQGDAIAIRSPAGRWILVDAGQGGQRFDAGRARVVPFLLQHGARQVDMLILTHPHSDHIGGAAAVMEAISVKSILDPGVPYASATYLNLLRGAQQQGVPWYTAHAGRKIKLDDMVIHFLHPAHSDYQATDDPNDYSVVFRLKYGEFAALFLGDVPAAVEEDLARDLGEGLRAQLLKVSHHGSITSTSPVFLSMAAPELAIIPVGAGNRFGHPHPTVLSRLEAFDVPVLRTDLHGNISVRVSESGVVRIETARGSPQIHVRSRPRRGRPSGRRRRIIFALVIYRGAGSQVAGDRVTLSGQVQVGSGHGIG